MTKNQHVLDPAINYLHHALPDYSDIPSASCLLRRLLSAASRCYSDSPETIPALALVADTALTEVGLQLPDYTVERFMAMCKAEYDRAHKKHNGLTPYHKSLNDSTRLIVLTEEIGEVARALTYDEGDPDNLVEELVQVATMALAWLARALEDAQAYKEAR